MEANIIINENESKFHTRFIDHQIYSMMANNFMVNFLFLHKYLIQKRRHLMRRIFTIGETVLDIIFKNGKVHRAVPGGSMLNTAVSIGRLKLPVYFISEYAEDETGAVIDSFLLGNRVNTEYIFHYKTGKTPLALAFLNDQSNATYSFYKLYPEGRLLIDFPSPTADDIILFGSIYSLTPETRARILPFIREAHRQGSVIIYDPNIRKVSGYLTPEETESVAENIGLASLVRASNEDCEALFHATCGKDAFKSIQKAGCENLIYTTGGKEVEFFSGALSGSYPVPLIRPVSTIGAGDNFNAGITYYLIKNYIHRTGIAALSKEQWYALASVATLFSAEVCMRFDNYISRKFAGSLK